jgi:hypothetical protein
VWPAASQPSRQHPADSPKAQPTAPGRQPTNQPSRQHPVDSHPAQPTAPLSPAASAQSTARQPSRQRPAMRTDFKATVKSFVRSVSDQLPLQRAVYLHDSGQFSFELSKIQSETRRRVYFICLGFNIKKAKEKESQRKERYLKNQSLHLVNLRKELHFEPSDWKNNSQ